MFSLHPNIDSKLMFAFFIKLLSYSTLFLLTESALRFPYLPTDSTNFSTRVIGCSEP